MKKRTIKVKSEPLTNDSNGINKLVIVESPAKCKKIESYLGPGYKVVASFGHLRHIPDLKSIDTENSYKISFATINEPIKQRQIEYIRKEIAAADEVILATDSDREGEAIAWHICDLFELNVSLTKRIVFNEITEGAIKSAIKTPTRIDMNLVNAQKTRQIIDMLVGFNISPFLWKHISSNKTNSLSAGRCQTPALRLVYDNYKEIQESPGKLVYNTTGCFTNMNLIFDLNILFTTVEQVTDFLKCCNNNNNNNNNNKFLCNVGAPKKSIRKAPEPLTTSSLQQLASNELHFSPKDTMKYAQQLYEAGYITYMRTDCKKYSSAFVEQVKKYIEQIHDKTYISQNIDSLIIQEKQDKLIDTNPGAQEAHEAIRPVNINIVVPDEKDKDKDLETKAIKLYNLIWKRTLESCMPSAQYNAITAKVKLEPEYIDQVTNKACEFSYKAEQISFPGFQIVERNYELLAKDYQYFSTLKQNTYLVPKKIDSKSVLHELVGHYSEAHLVKLLEDKGIGRPSTFASLIDKIQERGYILKQDIKGQKRECIDFSLFEKEIREIKLEKEFGNEKGKLVIQPIGIIVIETLIKHFDDFFNYEYTKSMETDLDLIATNKKPWINVCDDCNNAIINISTALKGEPKFSHYIDDSHEIIIGKFGPVVKRTIRSKSEIKGKEKEEITFIPVKKDLDLKQLQYIPDLKLEDVIDSPSDSIIGQPLGKYKGEDLYIKKGKYGLYVKWGSETRNMKELGNRPIENVNYMEVLLILEKDLLDPDKPIGMVRELSPTISIRSGKYGDYILYKKPRAKNPQFLKLNDFGGDYKKCNKDLILGWIKQTYKIE
jgi:DNA topoisomerase-1